MAHKFFIQARPCGNGEWKATGFLKGHSAKKYVTYGMTKKQAIEKAYILMESGKRYQIEWLPAKYHRGGTYTIIDGYTGEKFIGTSEHNYGEAVRESESQMPKAYFKECHPHDWQHRWDQFHGTRKVLLTMLIAAIIIVIIFILTGQFN
ncbi:MAG: hypothetical protein Q8P20_06830 [bacterium]|nr:hypothetical protein [bacterium]